MTGGNHEGAENIGTIKYESGTQVYVFSDLEVSGSSVQIQGGSTELVLAEVEVFERIDVGGYIISFVLTTLQWTTAVLSLFSSQ